MKNPRVKINNLCRRINPSHLAVMLVVLTLLSGCQTTISEDTKIVPNCLSLQALYFVDAHSQVAKFINTQSGEEMTADEIRSFIIQKMQTANIARTILAPRAGQTHRTILDVSNPEQGTSRIYPAIATKGNYYFRMQKRIDSGNFYALGEVLLYHAEKSSLNAPEVIMYPSVRRVQAIYQAAKKQGWPFIAHIEDAAMRSNTRSIMYQEMCRVGFNIGGYADDRFSERLCHALYQDDLNMTDHPVVFIHMAQLPPDRVKWLITHHSNVYFMTSHSDPIAAARPQPWINMFNNGELHPKWAKLIKAYPDRFIFALDNVTQKHWTHDYERLVKLWRNALELLPNNVAHAVAHGNAERLWGLPPLCYVEFPEGNGASIQPDNFP